MIPSSTIRGVISTLLKKHFPTEEVHFSTNFKAKADYFYIELLEKQTFIDKVYRDRDIDVSIHFVPIPDARGRICRSKLYEAEEKLDEIFLSVIQIGDRFITVQDTSSRIVSEVLHFDFHLQFADNVELAPLDRMGELKVNGISLDLSEEEEE